MPLFITVEDKIAKRVETHQFTNSPIRVGRNPLNDLQLCYPFVSEWHAIIRFDNSNSHYIDLGSTNGSVVSGKRVQKNILTPIGPGVELWILTVMLSFSRTKTSNIPATTTGAVDRASRVFSAVPDPQLLQKGAPEHNHPGHIVEDVDGVLLPLRRHYAAYRAAWSTMHSELLRAMQTMTPTQRASALQRLPTLFPNLATEPEFQALLGPQQGAPVQAVRTLNPGLARLANAFLPAHLVPQTSQDEKKLVGRVAGLLEGFSTALVELFKGHEQFGKQMAVQTIANPTRLQKSREPREVLAYLLDWTENGDGRLEELISAFADLMIHQVALLNGIVDGAKGMLNTIGPEAITQAVEESSGILKGAFRASRQWQIFCDRFTQLIGDDSFIARSIFSRDFARAYATVIGLQPQKTVK